MKELPHTRTCFVCGEANPAGLRLRFETDRQIVKTRFVPRPEHIGFRQTVHGGIIATVLDEIMVWACAVQTKRFAFCAELNVRFLHPLRPNQAVVGQGRLVANRRGKLFAAQAELQDESGTVLATGAGKYLPINDETLAGLADDLVGDASGLFT